MILSSSPGNVGPLSPSHVKSGSGSNSAPQTFMPFGRYVDVGPQKIKCSRPGIRLHVGSASTLFLNKGTLLGKDITYISQVWNAWDAESTQTFYEQVLPYIHPQILRPLMGIFVPTIINTHSTMGGLSLIMELPHPVGWRVADPYISAELKKKVVAAYQNIHARNILHNDVKLENVLIGDDDKVTIVDFCKMVVDPEPADLALEMRAVKFMLDYEGAKEIEYERLRRVESRAGNNPRRSWLRRAAKSLGLASETENDEPLSQDEIDLPSFSRQCLVKWDSEVVTEGTTHCPGWRGERFEVPEDMRSIPWPGVTNCVSPETPQREPADFSGQTTTAPGPKSFTSLSQWTESCHYLQSLWSSHPEPAESGRRGSVGTSSTPTDLSDYATGSDRGSTTGTDPSEREIPTTPPSLRKRLRTEDITRSRGSKRTRRSRSLESFAKYEGNQTSWATRRAEGLRSSWPSTNRKVVGEEAPRLVAHPREPSPDPSTFAGLSPTPWKFDAENTRSTTGPCRRASSLVHPRRSSSSSPRTLAMASPRAHSPRPEFETRCSIVVLDSDGEDEVWFISREVLRGVKGYLQVKKAAGEAMEMRLGGEEQDIRSSRLRAEKALHLSSARPTRKRATTPEESDEEEQKSIRRRSWPYVSKPRAGSPPCDR